MIDLKRFRKTKGLTQNDIADKIGVHQGRISRYESGRETPKTITNLLHKHFPDVTNYILDPSIETFETKRNTFKILNDITAITVPLIPMKAHAQYLDEFYESEAHDVTFELITLEVDNIAFGNYLAFDVVGDSMNGGMMYDSPSGARVLAREIGQHLWRSKLYKAKRGHIIITNKNILFKDIIDHDQENMIVTLHSRNNSPEYRDFDMPLGYRDGEDHILQIFKVTKIHNT